MYSRSKRLLINRSGFPSYLYTDVITYYWQTEVCGDAVVIHAMGWSCMDQSRSLSHGHMTSWQQRYFF